MYCTFNSMSTWAIFAIVLCSALFVVAEESSNKSPPNTNVVMVHPLTDMAGPSEDIETSFYLPEHPDQKLPIGESVTILCHFSNDGLNPLNVTAVMGSLNSPFDYSFYVQNFSYKPFGVVVKGGEEITLEYQFQLHPSLEPVDFTLSHTVFYESDSEIFSSTFFNQTVELYLPISDYDIETIFQVLFALFSTAFVGYAVFLGCSPDKPIPVASLSKKGGGGVFRSAFEENDEATEGKVEVHKKSGAKNAKKGSSKK